MWKSLAFQSCAWQVPDSEQCKICFDAEARVVLLPCGHGGLCEGCAKVVSYAYEPLSAL